ncbi:MAG: bifunctional aspartate transaminase/aspartate 4-decarboxylase [Lachnospiraceae bacterium]|nr:bifunctional aspartate transaminase/aspartate 4-decarboxylase [Lachnospiraceae bacterium]
MKCKWIISLIALSLIAGTCGCSPQSFNANTLIQWAESAGTGSFGAFESISAVDGSLGSATNTQKDAAQLEAEAELSKEIGAFEITARQRELARENEGGYAPLDAGRGNPNWINTQARYAFSRFNEYALSECERVMDRDNMAGQAQKDGIGSRFDTAMDPSDETDAFLIDAVRYCTGELGIDKDTLLKEWVDGIIGDYYPTPSRCLTNTEIILNDYLQSVLYDGTDLKAQTGIFPTEGGSAAMVYIFHALNHNRLLRKGDKIAIGTPIFTPYTQIPDIMDYGLVSINVTSTAEDNWDIPKEELSKLEDPDVKAFFLVNPSNPASHALSDNTLDRLKEVVEKNPDLIILTDDVYGTFVEGFRTVYSVLPENTILVYSFSKLYGVTGWRLGLIAMHDENVADRLLARLPEEDREFLRGEYSIVTEDPDCLPFLDRVTADSRSIGLYHTSGLSTPSQIYMDFLALTHLVCKDDDPYIRLANDTVRKRYEALMNTLGLPIDDSNENSRYYTLIDIDRLVTDRYGADFTSWMWEEMTEIDFLNDLASKKGVVLMYGPGFEAPDGTVRISLANLNTEDYVELAGRLLELLDEYYEAYEEGAEVDPAA